MLMQRVAPSSSLDPSLLFPHRFLGTPSLVTLAPRRLRSSRRPPPRSPREPLHRVTMPRRHPLFRRARPPRPSSAAPVLRPSPSFGALPRVPRAGTPLAACAVRRRFFFPSVRRSLQRLVVDVRVQRSFDIAPHRLATMVRAGERLISFAPRRPEARAPRPGAASDVRGPRNDRFAPLSCIP